MLAFRELVVALQNVGTDTLQDKIKSLAVGFDGRCPLAVRTLCANKLVSKDPALLALYDLKPYIPEYLSFTLTANSTGVVPTRLAGYSILGKMTDAGTYPADGTKFVQQLLAFNFVEADWVNSPGGLAAWYRAKKGVAFLDAGRVNPLDAYTSKEVVENLGEFVHQILVALGAAQMVDDVRTDGCTFKDWTRIYAEHLEMTLALPTLRLQYEHLDACHGLYLAALRKIGNRFRDIVMGVAVAEKTLEGGLLRHDEEPISLIFRKRSSRETIADLTSELGGLLPGFREAVSADPSAGSSLDSAQLFILPKRSGNPSHQRTAGTTERELASRERKLEAGPSAVAAWEASGMAVEPGSLESTFQWVSGGKELHISGLVWKIEALGRRLGIPVAAIWSKCWPYLLTRRSEAKKQGLCSKLGKEAGHKHARDTAHVTRPVIDLLNSSNDRRLCRYPTEAEVAAFAVKSGDAGLPPSRLRGRGARGCGDGRGLMRGAPRGRGEKGKGSNLPQAGELPSLAAREAEKRTSRSWTSSMVLRETLTSSLSHVSSQ
ncbi:MAG: hypothetical protein SGPRY_008082 [Prymnesium sp.]